MITPQDKQDIDEALDEIEQAIKRHNQWLEEQINKLQHSSDRVNQANPALLKASKDALERLEASQPPKGGATDTVCKVLRRVIAQTEGEL